MLNMSGGLQLKNTQSFRQINIPDPCVPGELSKEVEWSAIYFPHARVKVSPVADDYVAGSGVCI